MLPSDPGAQEAGCRRPRVWTEGEVETVGPEKRLWDRPESPPRPHSLEAQAGEEPKLAQDTACGGVS